MEGDTIAADRPVNTSEAAAGDGRVKRKRRLREWQSDPTQPR
jgi:hypothetical protein